MVIAELSGCPIYLRTAKKVEKTYSNLVRTVPDSGK